ncbi:hypothetical protein [Streptomyces sp. NPDC002490]|uniref:hypothetical protein n=1 Tax=Streptomyces sp. NPDC002490 TaxID=3154416 RepID=UPI00332E3BC3
MPGAQARPLPLVPYITAWSSERTVRPPVITQGAGIGYADETPFDRDADGVLWSREGVSPGKGRPDFGRVHLLRQRRAMRRLLCQVCGGAADRNEHGVLWLVGEDDIEDMTTTHPPVCAPCAAQAVRLCPYLRRGHLLLRVQACVPVGVHGVMYRPGVPFPRVERDGGVTYDDPRIRWTRAAQLIVRLEGCEVAGPPDVTAPAPRR